MAKGMIWIADRGHELLSREKRIFCNVHATSGRYKEEISIKKDYKQINHFYAMLSWM